MEKLKCVIITFMVMGMITSSAQTVINNDTVSRSRVYVRAGIEPATMSAIGYQRNIQAGFDQFLTSYAEWNVSFPMFGFRNSELKIGGIVPLFSKGSFCIVSNLGLSVGSVSTRHFDSKKFAAADQIAFGFYKTKWFLAITAEYEKIVLTHLEHTDFYLENYYEDARDGWYKGAGGMVQFGLEGGRTIYKRYDLHMEMKVPFTEKLAGYGGSPFHVNLGLAYRF